MSKLCFILGCGETGMFMPVDVGAYVIGVNDAGKFKKHIDELLFINRPRHFQEPALYTESSRLTVIRSTPVKQITTLTTLVSEWSEHFSSDQIRTITVTRWRKAIELDKVYHTDNSPFTAMSLAVRDGYKDIVLWGVDMNNHRWLKAETSSPAFNQFAFAVTKLGVHIYKGHTDQSLNLPLWNQQI